MMGHRSVRRIVIAALLLGSAGNPALAQFDPARAYRESDAVAARFPAPAVTYPTPALAPGREDLTSQEELVAFLNGLAAASPAARLDLSARSQQGREIPVLVLSRDHAAVGNGRRPVVLVVALQHGNEPAGGEGALALAHRLAVGASAGMLDQLDVVIVPRANPDGAAAFQRNLANGIDANRDHTLLRTPEAQVLAGLFARYRPQVMLDCHEFTVGGRWLVKAGGLTRVDAMLQHATVPNLAPSVRAAAEGRVLPAIRAALDREGLTHDWYFTTDGSRPDAPVAMGGIGPDTGRNVAGLRNALSILIETRGIGLGRGNYLRRVHTHVVAAESIISLVAADPAGFLALSRRAAEEAAAARDALIIGARQTPETRAIAFVDPVTGADRVVTMPWLSSLEIVATGQRPRPAGYLIGAAQTDAIAALRRAGVEMRVLPGGAAVAGERYRVIGLRDAAKADGRGDDTGAGQIVQATFELERVQVQPSAGDVFVPIGQPLSGLVAALLEPESSAGLVANRLLPAVEGQLLPYARISADLR
jgi:hypothetical protein